MARGAIGSTPILYADLITASAGAGKNERLRDAFAGTPRERFVGPGPWKVFVGGHHVEAPTDDPAFLYQDVVVAPVLERGINNGQPVLHAINLAALDVKQGETVLHIGAGTGYYTAVLARFTGPTGAVGGVQIEQDLAAKGDAKSQRSCERYGGASLGL